MRGALLAAAVVVLAACGGPGVDACEVRGASRCEGARAWAFCDQFGAWSPPQECLGGATCVVIDETTAVCRSPGWPAP